MAVLTDAITATAGHLRTFDVRRDLNPVADLVELCFADTIDRDGQRYLRQMREAARSATFLRWAYVAADQAGMPLSGYVWEEDGHLVGNLSLIPFFSGIKRVYLIANVAVHPAYRRRGIARALTIAAVDHARRRNASATWLHVRDDNEAAHRLYLSLGFVEKARRSSWHSLLANNASTFSSIEDNARDAAVIGARKAHHWRLQEGWLARAYPADLKWHIPLKLNHLRPDLVGAFYRFLSVAQYRHWAVQRAGQPLAFLSWQATLTHADHLWLAVPEGLVDEGAINQLIVRARQRLSARRPLTLDFPFGWADNAIQSAGFYRNQTLIWMTIGSRR